MERGGEEWWLWNGGARVVRPYRRAMAERTSVAPLYPQGRFKATTRSSRPLVTGPFLRRGLEAARARSTRVFFRGEKPTVRGIIADGGNPARAGPSIPSVLVWVYAIFRALCYIWGSRIVETGPAANPSPPFARSLAPPAGVALKYLGGAVA